MSLGVLDRKREMEYTPRHIAGSVCTIRIASPEELNKILKERGNQMGKRGPKPGFKRDKKVNQVELVDQATIKGSKALASAVRAGIEEAIDAASVTQKADQVTENATLITEKAIEVTKKGLKDTQVLNWDVLAAQTKGAVLQKQAFAKKPTIDDVMIWPLCTECDTAVDPDNFDHASNTCTPCKDARIEALQFMDRFKLEPKGVKPAADEGEFIDQLKSYTAVAMRVAEPAVEWTPSAELVKQIRHEHVCQELTNLYLRKNHDYGDSFSETYRKLGIISAVTRITDKVNRVQSLCTKTQRVNDEGLRDTLIDLANYAIMTVMEMEASSGHTQV